MRHRRHRSDGEYTSLLSATKPLGLPCLEWQLLASLITGHSNIYMRSSAVDQLCRRMRRDRRRTCRLPPVLPPAGLLELLLCCRHQACGKHERAGR